MVALIISFCLILTYTYARKLPSHSSGLRIVGLSSEPVVEDGSAKLPWQARAMLKMFAQDFRARQIVEDEKIVEDAILNPLVRPNQTYLAFSNIPIPHRSLNCYSFYQTNGHRLKMFTTSFSDMKFPFANSKYVKAVTSFFSGVYKCLVRYTANGKLLAKAFMAGSIMFLVVAKVSQWYKHMGEMEIILDQTDYSYKSFGGNQNGIGVAYLSTLNYTAIEAYNYSVIFETLEQAIQMPRFPQNLREYTFTIGTEITDILSSIEKHMRIRLHNDFMHYQRLKMDTQEIEILKEFHRGVVLLQNRQADACLRVLRIQVILNYESFPSQKSSQFFSFSVLQISEL
jgi:hypothetical protein